MLCTHAWSARGRRVGRNEERANDSVWRVALTARWEQLNSSSALDAYSLCSSQMVGAVVDTFARRCTRFEPDKRRRDRVAHHPPANARYTPTSAVAACV
jgi:hypothetical protein